MSMTPDDPNPGMDPTTRRWLTIGGVAALGILVGVAVILLTNGGDDTTNVVTPDSTTTTQATTSTSAASTTSTTAAPAPGDPHILQFFAAPSPITCNGSNPVGLTLSWKTQNVQIVTIETDGASPGAGPFPPEGTAPIQFACPAAQHNYELIAVGTPGQPEQRQKLVVQGHTTPPTSPPPTKPPVTTTPTTKPPVTTTPTTKPPSTTTSTIEPPTTTTTTHPVETHVAVAVDDTAGNNGPMTLTANPTTAVEGKVTFTVENTGTVAHGFTVLKTGTPYDQLPVDPTTHKVSEAGSVGQIHKIGKGKTKTLTLHLAAGAYVLVDNLPKHYQLGARAPFTVTQPNPPPATTTTTTH